MARLGNRARAALLVLIALTALSGCARDLALRPALSSQPTIRETLAAAGAFNRLLALAEQQGQQGLLDAASEPPVTLFAPTDAALEQSAQPAPDLRSLISPGRISLAPVDEAPRIHTSLADTALVLVRAPEGTTVNGAPVISADVQSRNGVVHVLAALPEPISRQTAQAIAQAPLPTERPAAALKEVRTPPAPAKAENPRPAAAIAGQKLFAQLLSIAGLQQEAQRPGTTLLVPDDKAWSRIPKAQIAALKRPENRGKLRRMLRYHIIPKSVASEDITGRRHAPRTRSGRPVAFNGTATVLTVNDAMILRADLRGASGAVIHLLDRVLIPR
ncbi:MAG: fasciclin domain-containing protein [Neomegalonema sp.]|nr:fasciclin domain-containing protein [Neomegalonema sp.]